MTRSDDDERCLKVWAALTLDDVTAWFVVLDKLGDADACARGCDTRHFGPVRGSVICSSLSEPSNRLPLGLPGTAAASGIEDKDGESTGFTVVLLAGSPSDDNEKCRNLL